MSLILTHQDDSPITGLSLVAERGADSAVVDLKILNNGSDDVVGGYLVLYAEQTPGSGIYTSSGQPVVDELMGRFQITGMDDTATPGQEITLGVEQPMGYLAVGILPTIKPGDWILADFWLHQAGGSAGGGSIGIKLELAKDQAARPIPFGVSQVGSGIDTGIKQPRSFFVTGRRPIPTGSPDDQVHVELGSWLVQGEEGSNGSTSDLTLNQNDGAAVALATGEEYIAVLSQGASTTPNVTKGVKAVAGSAVKPTPPSGELLLAWVTVSYNSGSSVISSGDIEDARVFGRYKVAAPPTGLYVAVHPGEAIIANFAQRRSIAADVTLAASATNYVWLQWDGSVTANTSATPPSPGAVKLAEVTTDASNVTANVDTRTYIRPVDAGVGTLTISDGVTTVVGVTDLTVDGTVTDLGGGSASLATGGGGGGGAATFGAYGSLPGSPSDGDVYHSTDVPLVSIRQSSAWGHFYRGYKVKPLVFGAFTPVEPANTIRVEDAVSVFVRPPASANDMTYYKKAAPSTPYHVIGKFIIRNMMPTNYNRAGIFLRAAGSGKFHALTICWESGTTHYFVSNAYCADPSHFTTTYKSDVTIGEAIAGANGNVYNSDAIRDALVCFRMGDDGTTRTCDYSLDGGVTWTAFNPVSPVGHATDLTPDEVGFWVGTIGGSEPPQVRFISWEETS